MNTKVRDMALCAMFAALISIGALGSIPSPTDVPFSLQPFFAMLAGAVLGSKRGAISMAVYTMMGLVGLPVFSNGASGFGMISKPTFGYILGFIVTAYVTGLIVEWARKKNNILLLTAGPFVGLILDYAIGVPYLYAVLNHTTGGHMTWTLALSYGFWPFIALDLFKATLVVGFMVSVMPRLKRAGVTI